MIEASADRFGDLTPSGDSPTVIRPPSPSIEEAGEENAGSMVQAAAHGVQQGVQPDGAEPKVLNAPPSESSAAQKAPARRRCPPGRYWRPAIASRS